MLVQLKLFKKQGFAMNLVNYQRKCYKVYLSHMLFADDVMIFAKVDVNTAAYLKSYLDSLKALKSNTFSVPKFFKRLTFDIYLTSICLYYY